MQKKQPEIWITKYICMIVFSICFFATSWLLNNIAKDWNLWIAMGSGFVSITSMSIILIFVLYSNIKSIVIYYILDKQLNTKTQNKIELSTRILQLIISLALLSFYIVWIFYLFNDSNKLLDSYEFNNYWTTFSNLCIKYINGIDNVPFILYCLFYSLLFLWIMLDIIYSLRYKLFKSYTDQARIY